MVRVRQKSLFDDDEEEERIVKKGKKKVAVTFDEDEDEEGLDDFEIDGFIVDNVEEEEEESPTQPQKKDKKRRRSSKNIVLDDDDLELINENKSIMNQEKMRHGKLKRLKKAGEGTELMEHSSDDGGSLFDEDESNDAEDDMADFIVDDEVAVYGKGDSLGQSKPKEMKHTSSLSKEGKHSFRKSILLEEHIGEVQIPATELEFPTNMSIAGEASSVDNRDIPERMQIIEDIVGSASIDGMSIEEESSWMLHQLASNINPLSSEAKSCRLVDTVKKEDIVRFLELYHTNKYDIPFIAMYRKEQCLSLLEDPNQDESENTLLNDSERKPKLKWHKILWIIKELDKKWLLLQKRKSMLLRYYNKHFEEECEMSFAVEESSYRKKICDSITSMLEKAETEREIDDIDMKFNLHFPPAHELSDSSYKRPMMKTYFSNCCKAGLWSLASKFGHPEKFGSLLTLKKSGIDVEEDPEESPEEIASMYKCETFQTSEAVLKGARHMAVAMLSCESTFRKYVRSIFIDKALVSTSPTSEGNLAIDSFHEFSGVKWLQDKPLLKFEDSQWFLIEKAEQEKLLQVKIKLPDDAVNELTIACNDAYLKENEGTSTRLWNEQRKLILQDAISNFLLPSMEKEARVLLNARAKNWLLMKYGMQLWNKVSLAPYPMNDNATVRPRGVVACCWGNGKPGTAFVMLDSRGKLVDVMYAESLALRSQNITDQQRRKNDQKRVLKFLSTHQPNVIVLGAANASCIRLKEDINEIISMMLEDNFESASEEMKRLPVVLGDEDLPRLYENSEISISQIPKQNGIVKRAVALGRYLLNPLAMVATLCGVQKEVVSWKLDPLEKFLTSDEKLEIIEWVMTDITNQVGLDINLAIKHDWLLAPLQFVSGLGPRKAGIFHRELLGGTDMRNRRDFAKLGLNTIKIFSNAVGFLQISFDDPDFVDSVGNPLDRTRIHPESYSLAEELARAVYRHDNPENSDSNSIQVNAIEYIQSDPKLLEGFDLNEYADRLETEKGENKRVTLLDIKRELLHGFNDPRKPYMEPNQDEEYYMITGEIGAALVEGKRVQAVVRHVQSKQAFCVLDSGMTGILYKEDFSDESDDIFLTKELHVGDVLTCKIKLIDKSRCQVHLTCKLSEMKNDGEQGFLDIDPYYCQRSTVLPSQQEATDKKELVNKQLMPRMISHPHFQNITADQAKEFLADKDVGEYIFHPSSRGPCYLTLSLKIYCGLCAHKDILEGGKSHDINSLLGLGQTLKVGEEIFESIDKVIEHYVNPLVVHLKAMISFRKFKKGSKAEVDELLKLEKEEFPNRIAYGLGISYEHPGIFVLSYIRSTNPHHEFIAIHHKGLKFRKQIFKSVEQLLAYFQNHINDKVERGKNHTTVESTSGGWKSNNDDQHKQSRGYNDHGDGRGAGSGRGRGRGGPGRSRGGRGRGFGPRSGSRDDCTGDGGDFGSSKGDFGSRDGTEDSFAAGKSWGTENGTNRNSDSGKWGGGGSNHSGSGGWAGGNSSGLKDDVDKSWGGGGDDKGCGNENNDTNKNEDNGKWGSGGSNPSGGGGWASGNSSSFKGNAGKGWGGGGDDKGHGSENDGANKNNDNGKWGSGGNNSSGGGGWASGSSSGFKGNNAGKSWGGGGDDKGHGSENDDTNKNTGNGKWGGGGSNPSSGGGWASSNSSGFKGNAGKSWGGGGDDKGPGSENDETNKNAGNGKWGSGGSNPSGGGGWASGSSSGFKGNAGKSWGGGGDDKGRGSENDTNKNNDSGKWGSGGSNSSGGGGWASGDSSGFKGNAGKSWGGGGDDKGCGSENDTNKNNDNCKWGSGGSKPSGGGGWGSGNSSGFKGNAGKSWGGGGDDKGRASENDDTNKNAGNGKWGSGGSNPSGGGGWASGNSSGFKGNAGKSWGGGGDDKGPGSENDDTNKNTGNGKWGGGGSNPSSGGGWASGNSSGFKGNAGKSWGGGGDDKGPGSENDDTNKNAGNGKWGSGGSNPSGGGGGWASGNSSGFKGNAGKSWGGGGGDDKGPGSENDDANKNAGNGKWGSGGSNPSGGGGWASGNSSGFKGNAGKSWGGGGDDKGHRSENDDTNRNNDHGKWGSGGNNSSGGGGWASGNSSGFKGNAGKSWGGGGDDKGRGSENDDTNRNNDNGKWGSGGSNPSGGGGWASGNSSGWKGNASKSWGGGGSGGGSDGGASKFNGNQAGGSWGDASNDSDWGQQQGGQERGRGRGRRGSQGDGGGRGRWGRNSDGFGRHGGDGSNDSGWEGGGRGRGRGWRGSQGDGRGRGRWGGNSTDD